jgi:phage shock protein A
MEQKIEGREAEVSAMAEVDQALGTGPDADDLEAKFRALEGSLATGEKPPGGTGGPSDVDDELAALKKRIRV